MQYIYIYIITLFFCYVCSTLHFSDIVGLDVQKQASESSRFAQHQKGLSRPSRRLEISGPHLSPGSAYGGGYQAILRGSR